MFNFPFYDYDIYSPIFIPPNCDKPPTLYTIMNSIVNGDKENEDDYTKIKDLWQEARQVLFDFDYPLSDNVSRETFEKMILNKFMNRRIAFDTVTDFKIHLDVKLNEIMPFYNRLFDNMSNFQTIFTETTVREGYDNTDSKTTANNNSKTNTEIENKLSDTPQDNLEQIKQGKYLSNYSLNNSESKDESKQTGEGNSKRNYKETITKDTQKIDDMIKYQKEMKKIYTLIFKDLDVLFYHLV